MIPVMRIDPHRRSALPLPLPGAIPRRLGRWPGNNTCLSLDPKKTKAWLAYDWEVYKEDEEEELEDEDYGGGPPPTAAPGC
eukprot:gene8631-4959_t